MNTLITAASSAAAQRLKNKLNTADVILGDYVELPTFMLAHTAMIKLPNPALAAYTHQMLTLCLDNNIDTIYPLGDAELTLLNQAALLFNEYGIKIMAYR